MPNLDDEFLIERYRHVLGQMAKVDENAHKFLAIFQAAATALLGAIGVIWLLHAESGISVDMARAGVQVALLVLCGLGLFSVVILIIGMFAWMDYRREEEQLVAKSKQFRREGATWKHLWRWQETYMIGLVVFVCLGSCVISFVWVLPAFRA